MKKWNIGFYVAGLLIFSYMIYAIGIDHIWKNIQKTGWWFFPVIGIWLVVYIINTFSWNVIVRNTSDLTVTRYPSFLKMLKITISGYCINYITPVVALGGEPYRIFAIQNYVGARKATSKVLSYSLMHILSHLVFWIASIILILLWLRPPWGLSLGLAITFCLFILALYMVFRGYRKGLVAKTFRILEKIPFVKKPIRKFSEHRLQTFQEIDQNIVNLYACRRPVFFQALFLEFLARLVSCLELLFIAKAIGVNMNMLEAIVLYAGSTLFSNIMFFSPMQLGTREGGLALTLSIMGFTAALGVYTGLVMRIRELFWIGMGLLLMRIK
ncbi:MAG: flippase-like domain-containing protein [Prevotellaceae bacterium]|jgi:hypothetical protein|nr:flippase-like domain-containing protein [Prevotellaceae bacterium]